MAIQALLPLRAASGILLVALLTVGCGATGPTPGTSPDAPPRTAAPDPTAVPVATTVPTPGATPGSDAGLGCGEPIGAPDEMVLVSSDHVSAPVLLVDVVAPDGARRRIAEIEGLGSPRQARVTPCGQLAVQVGEQLTVADLRDPGRRVVMPDPVAEDFEWDVDRGGRVTMIDNTWGNVVLFDPRQDTVVRTPSNGDLRTLPEMAWDGSGWYAEVGPPDNESPPRRVGIVDGDGVFRRSAVLVFDPLGFLWRTRADGAQAWVRPEEGGGRTVDIHGSQGEPVVWRRIPPDRQAEAWAWDATGLGLWLVERGPNGLHILHLDGPSEATEVATVAPATPDAWIAALGPADDAMLFTPDMGEDLPVTLLRADLSTGAVTTLVDDLDEALLAGWAAPAALPAGVLPPAPYGEPETAASPDRPVAPDLPLDALAIVTCSGTGTDLNRPSVRALEDGVHFLVRHPDGTAAGAEAARTGPDVREADVMGTVYGYAVESLPPGTFQVDCGEGPVPTPVQLEVLDPARLYRSPVLECPESSGVVGSSGGDPVPGPEAAAWLRPQLTLAPGDVVAPAGYPSEAGPPITVERGGRVVAVFRILRSDDELGIISSERCKGVDVGPNR